MLKKTITYTDFDGVEHTEDFRFNLTRSEIAEIQVSYEGGLENYLKKLQDENDGAKIMLLFKDIIAKAYGEKSEDGKRFIKSPKMAEEFLQTEAYDELFWELVSDQKAASAFMMGIIPQNLPAKA